MSGWLLRVLLALYPSDWRSRYGQELRDLIGDLGRDGERSRVAMVVGLVVGAVRERARVSRVSIAGAGVALAVVVALAAAALLTVSSTSHGADGAGRHAPAVARGPGPPNIRAPEFTASVQPENIQRRLHATIKSLCSSAPVGRRVTAIELDPATGRILGKIVQTCGTTA